MLSTQVIVVFCLYSWCEALGTKDRYAFYRRMKPQFRERIPHRFSDETEHYSWSAMCALLDKFFTIECSGSIIADRWVLSAGHCIVPKIAYIKYNLRHFPKQTGDHAHVFSLFRHPDYREVQFYDDVRGPYVTYLQNDIGLIKTFENMILDFQTKPLWKSMSFYEGNDLLYEDLKIFSLQKTQKGDEVFGMNVRGAKCYRVECINCVCGLASEIGEACLGDSGGPVVYRGTQVAVISLGPLECAKSDPEDLVDPKIVFTSLSEYANLINNTILDKGRNSQQLVKLNGGAASPSVSILIVYLIFVTTLIKQNLYS